MFTGEVIEQSGWRAATEMSLRHVTDKHPQHLSLYPTLHQQQQQP